MREAITEAGGGSPLAPEVAATLARGIGVDPTGVHVHTGSTAATAAAHLGVRAFTWGRDVYLGPGERATDVALIAHEVTHAVQQSGGTAVHLFDGPHGALEAEAHAVAATVTAGGVARVSGRTGGGRVQGLFGIDIKGKILDFVKDKASSLPGYDLLGFALGRDPITQQPVERTAVNLIKGVLGLVPGGQALFENLQKANVIQRAFDWFTDEITKLNITWSYIRGLFSQAWDALSVTDLLSPSGAWEKLKNIFGPPLGRLAAFAVAAGKKVLEFIFEGALALAGGAGQQILAIFRRIGSVFGLIVEDPLKFLGNLLSAVKGGVGKFKDNILSHLRTGLFEWLVGALEGVTLPKTWDFAGILSLILQILGLTYQALRAVLVKLIGEPAVAFVEKAFDFLITVVTKGLTAAWDKIKEFASDLADTVIGGIRDWLVKSVVGAAITKLVTMFNPVGAIIQGIITIYNTVMFFIERAQQIARLVNAVVDSVENIATGNVTAAIAFVEKTMANTLPVILGFLARFIGLGNVTKYVRDIIAKIRGTITNAIEKVGLWIKGKVQGLLAKKGETEAPGQKPSALADDKLTDAIDESVPTGGTTHHLKNDGPSGALILHSPSVLVNTLTDSKVQELVKEFNAAKTKTAKRDKAKQIAKRVAEIMPATGPGGSAPNIGNIQPHSKKGDVESAVPLWSLRSEHVVPFAVVRKLWEALGVEGIAPRKGLRTEDNALTTILIYLGAGKEKDRNEPDLRKEAQKKFESETAKYVQQGDADTPAADAKFRTKLMGVLRGYASKFIDLTWAEVQNEHARKSGPTTHGALRGEPKEKPPLARIKSAATTELDDADRILGRALDQARRP